LGERAKHGFGIRQRDAADEMNDRMLGAKLSHRVPPSKKNNFLLIYAA
jgi:hypothetical protein